MSRREIRYITFGALYCIAFIGMGVSAHRGHAWLAGALGFCSGVFGMRGQHEAQP